MKIKVPQLCWYENNDLELDLPESWNVELRKMKGHDNPKISPIDMKAAFSTPIGSESIHELAKGKKKVVIIFDDLTRPTRVSEIVPFVLEELSEAGIQDHQIRFVAALGTHGALTLREFQKKLGAEIPEQFPVYNHNPYENCIFVGKTSRGTPVSINKEVMACDLKIAIGCIVPHVFTGFGGGGKIILPGIASIESSAANHKQATLQDGERLSIMGKYENNPFLADIEEATKLAGLDIKIDAIINAHGETTHLFVGDPIAEFYKGVEIAKEVYATDPVKNADIVIANAFAKANEGSIAVRMGVKSLKNEGGDLVLLANSPEGYVVHYLYGVFGNEIAGRLWTPKKSKSRVNNLIIFTQYIDKASWGWYAPPEDIIWAKSWNAVLKQLDGQNTNPTVAIYPDLTIQYFVE